MAYPVSLDSFSTLVDNVDNVLAADMNSRAVAIVALETKTGVDNSAVNTTIDYFLKHASGAYRLHTHDGSSDDGANIPVANITGTLPVTKGGTGATAAANAASGVVVLDADSKLPAVDGSQLTGVVITNNVNLNGNQFGAWASKSNNTSYQAATDGFVLVAAAASESPYGYTDGSNPPTTQRIIGYFSGFCMPVRKGDWWKVTGATTVYWLPMGS